MTLSLSQRLRRGFCIFCPRRLTPTLMHGWRSCPCCHHRYRMEYSWNGKEIEMWEQRPLFNAWTCPHRAEHRPNGDHREEVVIRHAS